MKLSWAHTFLNICFYSKNDQSNSNPINQTPKKQTFEKKGNRNWLYRKSINYCEKLKTFNDCFLWGFLWLWHGWKLFVGGWNIISRKYFSLCKLSWKSFQMYPREMMFFFKLKMLHHSWKNTNQKRKSPKKL